jgi:hypothetical protein
MSTTAPVPQVFVSAAPVYPPTNPIPTNAVSAFLKHHETLLIIVFGFLLFWFVSGRVENIIAAHDNANLTAVRATLAAQVDADKKTADLVAQQAADMKSLSAKVLAQDAVLAQANKALATALAQRQQTNNTLTPSLLVSRWNWLIGSEIDIAVADTVKVSIADARLTVNELERVPVLTEQLANETKVAENTTTLLTATTAQVDTLNVRVAGLLIESDGKDAVCKAEIKTVKDAATKSKRRWFVGGFIAGFASRQALKTYFGF